MNDNINNDIKKYEKKLNTYENNDLNYSNPIYYKKDVDDLKTVFKYEDWQLDRIRKYFKNGIIPVSTADFDNKLKDGVSQELRCMLELAVIKIIKRADISSIVYHIGQIEKEEELHRKGESVIKYEQEYKYKDGNPYIVKTKEKINIENIHDKNQIEKIPDKNINFIDKPEIEKIIDEARTPLIDKSQPKKSKVSSSILERNDLTQQENPDIHIVEKYFKDGKIPTLSDTLEEKLVDKNISNEIKEILSIIVIKYGIDEDITDSIETLKRLENENFMSQNEKLKDAKLEPLATIGEESKYKFPKEGELDLSRVKTGRNLYDILTYDEKIEFLKEHPEYSTSHLPEGFFSVEEARRFEEENPLYNLKNTHIDFDKLDLTNPSNVSIDLEGTSIGDIKAPERISSDAEFRGIKIEDINLEDTREFKISKARLRYREKSALWKFLNKSLNPDNIKFDDLSDEEIDRLYR